MKEEFLHYLWKYRLYDQDSLVDHEDNRIEVIHPGDYNRDSGPDFFNARIRLQEPNGPVMSKSILKHLISTAMAITVIMHLIM